jgi:hypothetical protein
MGNEKNEKKCNSIARKLSKGKNAQAISGKVKKDSYEKYSHAQSNKGT